MLDKNPCAAFEVKVEIYRVDPSGEKPTERFLKEAKVGRRFGQIFSPWRVVVVANSFGRLHLSLAVVAASDICRAVPSPGAFVLWCLIKVLPKPVGSKVKNVCSIKEKPSASFPLILHFFKKTKKKTVKMPSSSDKPAATAT